MSGWMAVEYTQMGESIPLVGLGVENENLSHFVSSVNVEKPEKLNTSFWRPLTTPLFRAQAHSFLTKISSLLSQAWIPWRNRREERYFFDSQKDHNKMDPYWSSHQSLLGSCFQKRSPTCIHSSQEGGSYFPSPLAWAGLTIRSSNGMWWKWHAKSSEP